MELSKGTVKYHNKMGEWSFIAFLLNLIFLEVLCLSIDHFMYNNSKTGIIIFCCLFVNPILSAILTRFFVYVFDQLLGEKLIEFYEPDDFDREVEYE